MELSSCASYDEIIQALKNRFSESQQSERFRAELESLKRSKGESLKSVYQNVCRLFSLAFPQEKSELATRMARDYFLRSLNNERYRLYVLERGACSIGEAYDLVARLEAISQSQSTQGDDDMYKGKVRGVDHPLDNNALRVASRDNTQMTLLSKTVSDLQESMRQLMLLQQQQQQQLSDVCSRLEQRSYYAPTADSRRQNATTQQAQLTGYPGAAAAAGSAQGMPPQKGKMVKGNKGCWQCGSLLHRKSDCRTETGKTEGSQSTAPVQTVQSGLPDMRQQKASLSATIRKDGKITYVKLIVDTGACVNLCPPYLLHKVLPCNEVLKAANNTVIQTCGKGVLHFKIKGLTFRADVYCTDVIDQVLLGMPFLTEQKAEWSFVKNELILNGQVYHLQPEHDLPSVRRVYAEQETLVPSQAMMNLAVQLRQGRIRACVQYNYLLEARQLPDGLMMAPILVGDAAESCVRIYNPTCRDVLIRKNQMIGVAQPLEIGCGKCGRVCFCEPENSESEVDDVTGPPRGGSGKSIGVIRYSGADSVQTNQQVSPRTERSIAENLELIRPMIESLPSIVSDEQRARVQALLLRYIDTISKNEWDVGCVPNYKCKLELKDPHQQPLRESLRKHPFAYNAEVRRQTDALLNAGLIRHSNSPWACNLVLVKKRPEKPGDKPKIRLAYDFRRLNLALKNKSWPLGNMENILQSLRGAKLFHQIDLRNAFMGVQLDESSQELTSFLTPNGQFCGTRLLAGLSISPSVYAEVADLILGPLKNEVCFNWVDDFICRLNDFEDGLQVLERVLERFRMFNVRIHPVKTKLFQTEARVLGTVVSEGYVRESAERRDKMAHFQMPKTQREVKALVGFLQFGKDHYQGLAEVLKPWTDCLRKGAKVVHNEETVQAFHKLKEIVENAPPLALFDPYATTVLETDSSSYAMGCILKNVYPDGREETVSFGSKCLNPTELRYCTFRKELLAAKMAIQRYRHLLEGRFFVLKTDNSALSRLLGAGPYSDVLCRYIEYFQNFQFEAVWVKNSKNKEADFLSRARCDGTCQQCKVKLPGVRRMTFVRRPGRHVTNKYTRPDSEGRVEQQAVYHNGRTWTRAKESRDLVQGQSGAQHQDAAPSWKPRALFTGTGRLPEIGQPLHDCHVIHGAEELLAPSRPVIASDSRQSASAGGHPGYGFRAANDHDCDTTAAPQQAVSRPRATAESNSAVVSSGGAGDGPAQGCEAVRGAAAMQSHDAIAGQQRGGAKTNNHPRTQQETASGLAATVESNSAVADNSSGNATWKGDQADPHVRIIETRATRRQAANTTTAVQSDPSRDKPSRPKIAWPEIAVLDNWSTDFLVKEQDNDPVIAEVKTWIAAGQRPLITDISDGKEICAYYRQYESLELSNGLVYRKYVDQRGGVKHLQLLAPRSIRTNLCQVTHCNILGHPKVLDTNMKQLSLYAYWPDMRKTMMEFISSCHECLQFIKGKPKAHGFLKPIASTITRPGQALSIDLVGKLPTSGPNRAEYLLTAQDMFSRYVFLFPIPSKSARHVAEAVWKIFLMADWYPEVRSDNGGDFNSQLSAELYTLTGSRHVRTLPYSANQNSVERMHSTMHSVYAHFAKHKDWAYHAPYVASALNARVSKVTGYSANRLHFGRELNSNLTVALANPNENFATYGEYVAEIGQRLEQAELLAQQTMKTQAVYSKRHFDKKVKLQEYTEGQHVYVYCPRKRQGQFPKWQKLYGSHSIIEKKINDILYLVKPVGKGARSKNASRLVHVNFLRLIPSTGETGMD